MNNRYKRYEPYQSIMHTFNPEETFPKGTFERFLVETMDELDISGFYSSKPDKGGETPFDPRAVLSIIFYSYCNSCFSARRMEKNCRYHMAYVFVSGYNAPDHSTISRFLNTYENQIIDLFTKMLYLADQKGFIDYKLIAIDGTKIRANGSERFIGTIDDFKKKETRLTKKIKEAIEKQKDTDADDKKEYWKKKIENYEKDREKISTFLKDAQQIKTESNTEVKQNIQEADSRVLKFKKGLYGPGYNAQAASCSSDFIIAADISNAASDTKNFDPMLKKVHESTPDIKKKELKKSKFLFDNGYYSADNIISAEKDKLDVYIADGQSKYIFTDDENNDKSSQSCIGSKDCELERREGKVILKCPGERIFDDYVIGQKNGKEFCRFVVNNPEKCKSCKLYPICTGKYMDKKSRKEFKIAKNIVDNFELIKQHKEKLHSEEGRMVYSRRMPIIEKVFGCIKGKLGFYRFLRKGMHKAKTDWLLGCMAYNLKRMFTMQTQSN